MKYQIFYTDSAKQDLKNIYRYICDSLVEPEIAEKLTDKIMKSIRSLDEMPQRYRLFDEEPWRSCGLRILPVNNYLIFYLSDEEKTVVTILRIIYGGRDISKQLSETQY